MKKSSDRAAADLPTTAPVAAGLLHSAADRVGPLAQSAAEKVGPLAEAAADRIGAAADKVSPLAHIAAQRLAPLAQTAAARVGPLAHTAADRLGPLTQSASARVTPLATLAVGRVSPYAQQAVGYVTPYAQQARTKVSPYAAQAAGRLLPLAAAARVRGVQAATGAAGRLGPAWGDAVDRVQPALNLARGKVTDELLPRLGEAVGAAAASPVVLEATKRGKATLAAARGELTFPEPEPPANKSRWLRRLLIVGAAGGAAVVVSRRLLGSKDTDWQAARPSTPYAPPPAAGDSWSAATDDTAATPADTVAPDTIGVAEVDLSEEVLGDVPTLDAIEDLPTDAPALDLTSPDLPASGADGDLAGIDVTELDVADVDLSDTTTEATTGTTENADLGTGDADLYVSDLPDVLVVEDNVVTPEEPAAPSMDVGEVVADDISSDTVPIASLDDALRVSDPVNDAAVTESEMAAATGLPTAPVDDAAGAHATADIGTEQDRSRYDVEGAYVGDVPPEGYIIKGNDRSMKYHLPDSPGYVQTHAEVWFNSEEAAQAAGFSRAGG